MYIRGIGSRLNSPAMSVYIDGMPVINKAAFNVYIYDLERVDVLRGPQGTLYGQNAEAGLLRMYSVNPMRQQGTKVKLSLGTYGYRLVEGAHHQRIGEKVAFSLAGFYRGQDGFFRNTALGTHADKSNRLAAACDSSLPWGVSGSWIFKRSINIRMRMLSPTAL